MTIEMYKERTIQPNQKVKVYYNLHKHVFSIADYKTGKVLAHGNHIQLAEPTYKVLESGRQRVLKEKKKNVHAFVIGNFVGIGELDSVVKSQYESLYYNPYQQDKFTVYGTDMDANNRNHGHVVLSDRKMFGR